MKYALYLKIFLIIIFTGCASTYVQSDYTEDIPLRKKLDLVKREVAVASPASLQNAINILNEFDLSNNKQARELYLISYKLMELAYPLSLKVEDALSESSEGFYINLFKEVNTGKFVKLQAADVSYLSNLIVASAVIKTNDQKVLDQCEPIIESAIKLNRLSVLPYYLYGLIYEKTNMPDKAIAFYDIALLIDPSVYAADIAKARIYLNQEKPSKVLVILNNLEAAAYSSPGIEKLKIQAYIKQKKYDTALDTVNISIMKYPDNIDLTLLRAKVLELIGQGQAASSLINELGADKKEDEILLLKAKLKYNSGDIIKAIEILEQAVVNYSNNIEIKEFYSQLLIESARTNEGLKILNGIISEYPDRYSAVFILMKYYYERKDWINAEKHIVPLLNLENSVDYYEYAYKIYLESGIFSKALLFAKTLFENHRDSPDYAINYIETLISTGNYKKSHEIIDSIISGTNDSDLKSNMLYYKALLYSDIDDKINYLEESIYENPLNEKSLKKLSDIYVSQEDYDRALYLLNQLKLINPEIPDIEKQVDKLNRILNSRN